MWLFLVASLCAADDIERLLADAATLLERGQPERAASLLRSGAEGPPGRDSRIWTMLGRASKATGDVESAASAFARASRSGTDLDAAFRAVECYLEMKDAASAKSVLAACGEPADPSARAVADELKGMVLFLEMKEEEARPHLERALAAGRTTTCHYLGLIHFHRGEYGEALKRLDEAVRADPEDYYSLLYRAWAFLELNRLDDARKALAETRAVAATPEVENMSGQVEARAERFEEALPFFRKALAANPNYIEAQFGIATALRRLGRADEAKAASAALRKLHIAQQETLRTAFTLNQKHLAAPRDAGIAEELARHYFSNADFQEAERFSWKVLSLDPERRSARLLLARTLAGIGRFREASFHYRKILRGGQEDREAKAELEDLIRKHARRSTNSDG
jgi:Flp pilus assembly protein TadD